MSAAHHLSMSQKLIFKNILPFSDIKMNISKVGNQTSSQDPQAVNSRSYCWDAVNPGE